MPLDPDMAEVLRQVNALLPMHQTPIDVLRARRARLDLPDLARAERVEDLTIPGSGGALLARLYRPAPTVTAPVPLVVAFHGGGFVFGSLASQYDGFCNALCGEARCVVLSVDYRLAPEHKFPAATEDCRAAVLWAVEHAEALGADPRRLIVAGGSAGGNLAAVTALRLRDEGVRVLSGQLLVYPTVDAVPSAGSYSEFGVGHYLTAADMRWFWEQYLRDPSEAYDPRVSPLRAASLAGLPPALMLTAEYDPLRDEGERYAERLREAGVATVLARQPGVIHGFLAFPTPRTTDLIRQAARWITALAPITPDRGSIGGLR